MTMELSRLLHSSGLDDIATQAENQTLIGRVSGSGAELAVADAGESLIRVAQIMETRAVNSEGTENAEYFGRAFSCWRGVSALNEGRPQDVDGDLLPWELSLAVHIAVSGTQSRRVSEVRQELTRILPTAEELRSDEPITDWARDLLHDVAMSFVMLTRKSGGGQTFLMRWS